LNAVPAGKSKAVSTMQKAIHAQEDRDSAQQKAKQVSAKLKALRLDKAARIVQTGAEETFAFYEFLSNHWRYICTNNPLEQLNREIRRRTRVVENFPDGHSALMLVAVRLRYFAGKSGEPSGISI
jgi:putative transposase